jgi:hypothetical protein
MQSLCQDLPGPNSSKNPIRSAEKLKFRAVAVARKASDPILASPNRCSLDGAAGDGLELRGWQIWFEPDSGRRRLQGDACKPRSAPTNPGTRAGTTGTNASDCIKYPLSLRRVGEQMSDHRRSAYK